ncbi:hypothetical protein MA16_Dca026300 [Dendrobium catenatum]|uniref:Uncharacterized protein n=1 Tax=Dendrobium catenatum TaxID=906689 RepID=A0A2I0VKW1_9ASPA|nr:hypothetical protein MA16_Dca026300 [Dendrobium catenatum]
MEGARPGLPCERNERGSKRDLGFSVWVVRTGEATRLKECRFGWLLTNREATNCGLGFGLGVVNQSRECQRVGDEALGISECKEGFVRTELKKMTG